MKKIAIIPARGGSKRIPHKNIRNFLGKPIIAYSIQAALESNVFDEVIVSTDDEEISFVAQNYGAMVPFMRSKKNSNDFASSEDVIEEVLNYYNNLSKSFEYFCCIYPTAPFVTVKKIVNTFNLMVDKKADAVVPVVRFSYPIQRALRINENNTICFLSDENINKRSQDLEAMYHDAGQFYWGSVLKFSLEKKLILKNTIPFISSNIEVQDIDEEEDWRIAEQKYKYLVDSGFIGDNKKIIF